MEDKLLVFDCNDNPTEKFYNKLEREERFAVDNFEKYCLISAGKGRAQKSKSNAIRFLVMCNKKVDSLDLEDLRSFLRILKQSNFSDYYKNDVKAYVQRFLKWFFKDWSERFSNFEDIKFNSDAHRTKEIKSEDVLSKEQVDRLIKAEPDIFWKTFLVIQYQGALRTAETRKLKWEQIDMEDTEIYWLNVSSKKNRNATERKRFAPPLDSDAVFLINELKKEQARNKKQSVFLFPSLTDLNKNISSGSVSMWFRRLTKKVLGHSVKNYLLRHSKGEELHKLVRDGKLSKENALLMMGHSEKMFDKTYSHADNKSLKQVLQKQMLNVNYIAPEKKHKLELEIEELKKINEDTLLKLDVEKIYNELEQNLMLRLISKEITRKQFDKSLKDLKKEMEDKSKGGAVGRMLFEAFEEEESKKS